MSEEGDGKNGRGHSLSESQYNASAESFDITCTICDELGKQVGAQGFCKECSEYLCKTCITHHRVSRATRRHTIQDEQHMPKDAKQIPLPTTPATDCTEQCSKHPGKTIEYFCAIHDELACHVDVTLDHLICGAGYIPELAKGIASSDEMKDLRTGINEIKQEFEVVEDTSREAIASTKRKGREYNNDVKKTGDELIKHIQSLVQQSIKENDEFVEKTLKRIDRSVEVSRKTMNEVQTLQEDIDRGNTSESQLFFHLKSSKSNVTNWRAKLTSAKLDAKPIEFSFKKSPGTKTLKEMKSLGELDKRVRVTGQFDDTDIKLPDDKEVPVIMDVQVLPDGRIALADYSNKSVKLVNSHAKQIKHVKLPSEPRGITQTDTGELVVTLAYTEQLQFLKQVKQDLQTDHVIKLNFEPGAIEAWQDKLLVCSSKTIMILGKDGTQIKTIYTGDPEKTIYYGISLNPYNNMLYACDWKSGEVKCLTVEGKVKGTYKVGSEPIHSTVLDDGSMLVTVADGIHHITSTGTKIQMLTYEEEMGHTFAAIYYAKGTGQLYLAGTILRVIQIE